MKQQFLYITLLLMPMLFASCSEDSISEKDDAGEGNYMRLSTKSGEYSGSDAPCFIFWKHSDFDAFSSGGTPTEPYVYSLPSGEIDDYKTTKYNTGEIYPPYAEPVYAVGISPAEIPGANPGAWKTFDVPRSIAGLVDIQCAPVIAGSEQAPFSDPLKFEHQLAKLEFKGYCGGSMSVDDDGDGDVDKIINVEDVTITVSSDVDGQHQWFPEKLTWAHGGIGVGQYKVSGYGSPPPEITAQVSLSNPPPGIIISGEDDTNESTSKHIGDFYLVPGFGKITVKVAATYIDSTEDDTALPPGNGQEIKRVWEEMTIENIHSNDGEPTEAGTSYTIYLKFERSKIVLGVTLKDWGDDVEN